MKPEALVLGGGIVGISIAESLAGAGIHVTLLEKGDHLGGKPSDPWIKEKASGIKNSPRVTVMTQAELKRVDGHLGQFKAKVRKDDGTETSLSPSVIIVATGCAIEQEQTKGLWRQNGVIGFSEFERLLSETAAPSLVWGGKKIENVTFLLDQANEDLKIDFFYVIQRSLPLQEKFGCQVTVLCRDVKVSGDGMERLYRKARQVGALFFKYEEPPRLSLREGKIRVEVKDTAAIRKEEQWPVSIHPDLLVVGESLVPNPETEQLAAVLKLHLGDRGFLMENNPQLLRVRSNRRGIFVAGGCRFPQELSESVVEAGAVAQEVISLLSMGTYTYELTVAEVDPKKCAVCYTCPRLCPHSAITIERYAERNIYAPPGAGGGTDWGAARVDPVACYGCGICVAECPARAITLLHLRDEQIYAQMNLRE